MGALENVPKWQYQLFMMLLVAIDNVHVEAAKQSAAKEKPLLTLRHQTIPPPRQDTPTSTTVYRPPTSGFLELSMMI